MLSRDYLLRQIEQFAQVIAKIAGWKKDGFFKEALEELNATIAHSGDSRRVIELLDQGQLSLPLPQDMPPDLITAVAELCFEKSQVLDELGNEAEAIQWQIKALHLLLCTLLAEPHILKMREENMVQTLRKQLVGQNLPPETQSLANRYFV